MCELSSNFFQEGWIEAEPIMIIKQGLLITDRKKPHYAKYVIPTRFV